MTAVTDSSAPQAKSWLRTASIMAGLVLLFGCQILLFGWPWLRIDRLGGAQLNQMVPLENGRSALFYVQGEHPYWESQNLQLLPLAQGLLSLTEAEQHAIAAAHGDPLFSQETLRDLSNQGSVLYKIVRRRLDLEGTITEVEDLYVRNDQGDFYISQTDKTEQAKVIWLVPIHLWTSTANQGIFREGESTIGSYRSDVEIIPMAEMTINGRTFSNCTQQRINIAFDDQPNFAYSNFYCEEVGLIHFDVQTDGTTQLEGTLQSSTHSGLLPGGALPPHTPISLETLETEPLLGAAQFVQFATFNAMGAGEISIPPLYVPAQPPLVLAAQINGPLKAFDANTAEAAWVFETGNTVFGQPQVDAQNGRLYFGSSDKQLYALDINGLFLWSVKTADNVVTRPLVYQDRLLVGGEDRNIYCVHHGSGRIINQIPTNGSIVSSPAAVGSTAVIGSDDGGVYGIDLDRCTQKWLFDAGGAVEAAIRIQDDIVFVTGRNQLAALDLETGTPIWTQTPAEIYRFAPALGDGKLFLVDDFNKLSAFDQHDGRLLWTSGQEIYIGSPQIIGNHLLLSSESQGIYQLDWAGKPIQNWEPMVEAGDPNIDLLFGPQLGGGRVWFADTQGRLYYLGQANP